MKKSRLLAGFFAVLADLFCAYFLKAYGTFHYTDVLYSALPVLIFLFIPESATLKIKKQDNTNIDTNKIILLRILSL